MTDEEFNELLKKLDSLSTEELLVVSNVVDDIIREPEETSLEKGQPDRHETIE